MEPGSDLTVRPLVNYVSWWFGFESRYRLEVELSTFFGSFRKLGLGFNARLLLQDDRNPAADNFLDSGTFDGDVQMRVRQKPGQE